MLVIRTATAPDGRVTHHLVRADPGAEALRRVRPPLPAHSRIGTYALHLVAHATW